MAKFAIAIGAMVLLLSCGVRGPPQPPLTPAELGRGQPTFKRATEEFAFPNVPSPSSSAQPSPEPESSPKKAQKPSNEGN